ncbi:hypothetical protein Tco_1023348 [Tanacetum coccineum]
MEAILHNKDDLRFTVDNDLNESSKITYKDKLNGTILKITTQSTRHINDEYMAWIRGKLIQKLLLNQKCMGYLVRAYYSISPTRSWFRYYRVTLGFGSIAGGLDPVNLVIRLPIEHGINSGTMAPGVVKPEIGGNVNFEIKSQFMRELREDAFLGNKNEDAHDHIDRVLNIVSLFNIPGVSKDAVLLRVFPFTLTGSSKRWVDRLTPGAVNTWDLLKNAFIQRYYPPSKTAKQLEDIHNFKQECDESLYQAWERYNDLLYKYPTHDINNHQKGPIPEMTPTQALTAIQDSQKWHDGTSSRSLSSSSNTDGLAAIVSKLYNLGCDMKKLKENVHAIQVGCQFCKGPHLDNKCPLNEEVKQVEEVNYGEFGHTAPFNGSNRAKYREESARRSAEMKEWFKKHQENAEINTRNQCAYLKNIETQIEQLTKELHSRATNEAPSSSIGQYKMVNADHKKTHRPISSNKLNNIHKLSFLSDSDSQVALNNKERTTKVLQCKLPPKEQNPRVSHFLALLLTNLRKTNMLIEIADMVKKAPLAVVENILVGIDKFLFPTDFVIINRTPNETIILGKHFLATIHAKIHVFKREISLGVVRYGGGQLNDLIWGQSYAKWYKENSHDNKPRPREYTFREWMIVKVGHTNVNESVKKALLKFWVIDCFEEALDPDKDPRERSFDDYKWLFVLEIEQLDDEYELGIRKKGHILEMIWENCKNIQGKAKEWWYDYWLEEDKKLENGDKKYDPPKVNLETFEVTRYSFDNGNSFIYVTNEIKNTLSLGRDNGSRFRKMTRQEMNQGEDTHDKTVLVTPGSVITTGSILVSPGSVITTGSILVSPGSVITTGSILVSPGSVITTGISYS